jgi:hypothetical protein
MANTNTAANVISLEAFRQKKMREERGSDMPAGEEAPTTLVVPIWFCWVPMWTPFVG